MLACRGAFHGSKSPLLRLRPPALLVKLECNNKTRSTYSPRLILPLSLSEIGGRVPCRGQLLWWRRDAHGSGGCGRCGDGLGSPSENWSSGGASECVGCDAVECVNANLSRWSEWSEWTMIEKMRRRRGWENSISNGAAASDASPVHRWRTVCAVRSGGGLFPTGSGSIVSCPSCPRPSSFGRVPRSQCPASPRRTAG